jgi:hypothetical protein
LQPSPTKPPTKASEAGTIMTEGSITVPSGVYRTPGRTVDPAPIPLPSWRTLVAPLTTAVAGVTALVLAVLLFNCLLAPAYHLPAETAFIPFFDQVQDGIMLLLPASLLLLVVVLLRRVVPSWQGLRRRTRVVYVASLLIVQSLVAFAGEATVFFVRGGLHLFEPTWKSSTFGPKGQSAHVYREGFGCGYDVYVSEPLALTMKKQLHVGRTSCEEPLPAVRWNPSGSVDLVDRDGKPLESQATRSFLGWGGGC